MRPYLNNFYERFGNGNFKGWLIIIWLLITSFFGYQLQYLTPDFEFEKFFPTNDPDIAFYESHLEQFNYDNDYLLLILENEEGVFEQDFLNDVGEISEKLFSIGTIDQVINPTEFKHLISGPFGVTPVPLIHADDPAKYSTDSTRIYGHPVYKSFFDQDGKSLMVQIIHAHLEDPGASDQLVAEIEDLLNNYSFDNTRIVGKLVAQDEFISLIQKDFTLFLAAALILSFILLVVIFRSVKIALLPYLISITTLIWLLGLMSLLGYTISILGSLIPPVILFVSSSDAIHLINAYRHDPDRNFTERLKQAVKKVFAPTLLTSVTTAIGFFSLISINTEPIQNLGIFTGIGVLFAFIVTFGFSPLLIKQSFSSQANVHRHRKLVLWIFRHQRGIIITSIMVVLAAIYGTTLLKTDAYLLQDLPDDSTVRAHFTFVDQQYGGSKPWELAYWPKDSSTNIWDKKVMDEARKIQQYLEEEYRIDRLWSPVTFLKYGHQMINGGMTKAFEYPPDQSYNKSRQAIRQFTQRNELPKLIVEGERYARFAGYIPEYGSYETIQRNMALLNFLDKEIDNTVLQFRLTGTTYLIDKSHELLSANLLKGLLIAIAVISLILGLYFKSFKMLIISMIPNIIPLLFTAGFMGITGISLKLTTSIIFAVAFGIAVDDTIHLVSVYQKQKIRFSNRVLAITQTFHSAGKAIIITTLVIVAGFGLFIFSSFGATYFLGLFMSISLVVALITDLTLLPLLLHYSNKRHNKTLNTHEQSN